MRIISIILLFLTNYIQAQSDYEHRLKQVICEIEQERIYDNNFVIYPTSENYRYHFEWEEDMIYYENDYVGINGSIYRALNDHTTQHPDTCQSDWELVEVLYHPYIFLRDSSEHEDLLKLIRHKNSHLRCYAFGALIHNNYSDYFDIVLSNLSDSTQMMQMTNDFGNDVSPADLMLDYCYDLLTTKQKEIIVDSIIFNEYAHLFSLKDILLSHKPIPKHYLQLKKLSSHSMLGIFGAVALSRYRNPADTAIILSTLGDDTHFGGYQIRFMAIENFPHAVFKNYLKSIADNIKMKYHMSSYKYYFHALAAYKSKDMYQVLEKIVDKCLDKSYNHDGHKSENLFLIKHAMIKHYDPMYVDLIAKIDLLIEGKELDWLQQQGEKHQWDY